ncbi:Dimodular nonribosomal peptide synthase [Phytophthora nicotianae]|uniref:Dimodular nonribosomal peptide synthase n=1 Tax=Phytophthora nicotianae TaxID=4792 RepID=A0A0W8DR95_PHYNI|nr:Dimodular nonribosomal peptide synthase [Phytophthora nicotianae]
MHYSMKQKRDVLLATLGLGIREAARVQKIPRRTLESWLEKKEDIFAFRGSEKTLSRASGRPEIIPFKVELIAFMKDKRRESLPLTASIMAAYIRDEYSEWQEDYAARKKDIYTAYQSLQRLLQRFAYRHGFVQRTPHGLKVEKLEDLVEVQDNFARLFMANYSNFAASQVYNCDETGIHFDAPPGQILSEKGQSSAITAQQKHSARLTAVCTIRADGVKLPLLFILRGEPNGIIEKEELPTYPEGHIYTVQTKAWMDTRLWRIYLRVLLQQHITQSSLLLVDNLECHVSGESEAIVSEKLKAVLQPLPKNATSVCQPLDVGIMGPLKAKLKALWLFESTTATSAKEKRLATIKRAISAWESIAADTVTSAFNKTLKTNF